MQEGSIMKVKKSNYCLFAAAFCSSGLLAGPPAAEAQNATHYWAVNGSVYTAPYVATSYICNTNYYVDPKGSDANSGTSAAPWQTISGAVRKLSTGAWRNGVCVNVNAGTYVESVSLNNLNGGWDGPQGYLVFRSSVPHEATLQEPYANISTMQGNVVIQNSHYVIFDGFTVTGYPNIPLAGANGLTATRSHHIKFLNNVIHDVGGSGVAASNSDYVATQGNVVYDTSCCSAAGTSAIDYYEPVASDTNSGFHNVISQNIAFNNSEGADGRSPHTQGHGITLDSFRLGPSGSYPSASLVENNLIYGNGGVGINVYASDNVTIRNNTVFNNLGDSQFGYAAGDISVWNSSHVTGVNNIAVTNALANSKLVSIWDQTWDGTNIGNVWANNLTFNGNPGAPSVTTFGAQGSGAAITAASRNILGTDPLFDNAPAGSFTLQDPSPAAGAGTAAYGVPLLDLGGNVRSTKTIDIGAFAHSMIPPS